VETRTAVRKRRPNRPRFRTATLRSGVPSTFFRSELEGPVWFDRCTTEQQVEQEARFAGAQTDVLDVIGTTETQEKGRET